MWRIRLQHSAVNVEFCPPPIRSIRARKVRIIFLLEINERGTNETGAENGRNEDRVSKRMKDNEESTTEHSPPRKHSDGLNSEATPAANPLRGEQKLAAEAHAGRQNDAHELHFF